MSKRTYSEEMKAAVLAALLAGQSVSQVAKEYKVPKGTVSAWKTRTAAGVASTATQKGGAIGELLVDLVEANVRGLIAVAGLMQDTAWLREQSASEVGTLAGITHDKVIRMLEAMGGPGDGVDAQ